MDFIAFCGFPLDELPRLLNEINRQLQSHGLMMQKTKGAIVDATLITSAARPRTTMTVQTDDNGDAVTFEDGSQPSVEVTEKHSADPEANGIEPYAWLLDTLNKLPTCTNSKTHELLPIKN